MNPFDVDTDWGHKLAQHIPLLGMVAARVNSGAKVEFWHLIVAIIGLGVLLGSTFGTIIWNESRQQTHIEEQIAQIKHDAEVETANVAYFRRRQEINEDTIHQLQTDAALLKENGDRMIREHADIYQAIRGIKR